MRYGSFILSLLLLAGCSQPKDGQSSAALLKALQDEAQTQQTEDAEPAEEIIEEIAAASIYYRHPSRVKLVPVERDIIRRVEMTDQIKQVIDLLSLPPEDGEGIAIWPSNTYLREVFVMENGTLVIDFSPNFLDNLSVGSDEEALLIASLVMSLLDNFSPYDKVRILVDGQTRESLMGHVDIENVLSKSIANRFLDGYQAPPPEANDDVIFTEEVIDPVRNALQDNLSDQDDPDGE